MSFEDFLRLYYASISAIHDGKAAEISLDFEDEDHSVHVLLTRDLPETIASERYEKREG